ncbi:hypothetical protein HK100_000456 [Physocladia obscura]|uniref:Uncharacterized protein n=1 Tax=Physocladia obscura TaxID=109957 RepID=A0AAD5XFK7_9FUNG|nr:hypothetical protein HK100_000456 [Physocladia obscura]
MSENNKQTSNTQESLQHTFFGFPQTPLDAALIVEACVAGELQPVNAAPMDGVISAVSIQSGTVLVFSEGNSVARWTAVEPVKTTSEIESSKQNTHVEYPNEVTSRFINLYIRGACRFIPNGLAKRTIGVDGSDGNRYRVVSYFYPKDVEVLFDNPQDLSDYQFANGIANLIVPISSTSSGAKAERTARENDFNRRAIKSNSTAAAAEKLLATITINTNSTAKISIDTLPK